LLANVQRATQTRGLHGTLKTRRALTVRGGTVKALGSENYSTSSVKALA